MGTILASAINARVIEILQDRDNLTWSSTEVLAWINDALRALIYERPDANLQRRVVKLYYGTRQTLTGTRLHCLVRNMGAAGSTPGRGIALVSRDDKDNFSPDWHSAAAVTSVREYMYDPTIPREYYVSPPVSQTTDVYVELQQFEMPTEVASLTDTITVDDIWAPALIEWVAFRCTERDAEETPQIARQNMHFERFFTLLDRKMKLDYLVSPRTDTLKPGQSS